MWFVEATQLFPKYVIDKKYFKLTSNLQLKSKKELKWKELEEHNIKILWDIYTKYWLFKISYLVTLKYLKNKFFYWLIFKNKKTYDDFIEYINKNWWKLEINKDFIK